MRWSKALEVVAGAGVESQSCKGWSDLVAVELNVLLRLFIASGLVVVVALHHRERNWERLGTPRTRPGTTVRRWERAVIREGAGNTARSAQSFRFLSVLFHFLSSLSALLKFYQLNELKIQIRESKLQ